MTISLKCKNVECSFNSNLGLFESPTSWFLMPLLKFLFWSEVGKLWHILLSLLRPSSSLGNLKYDTPISPLHPPPPSNMFFGYSSSKDCLKSRQKSVTYTKTEIGKWSVLKGFATFWEFSFYGQKMVADYEYHSLFAEKIHFHT